MTDKEIIKALECCVSDENCESCPLHHKKIENACTLTVVEFYKEILDLIKSQQAEIERLTINMNAFGLGVKREKERADTIRAEAIEEVFDKIKAVNRWSCVDIRYFDKVYKEMVGEQK